MSGIQEILIGPSRRWREDALRNLPFMHQTIKEFPILQKVQQNIMTSRRFFRDVVDRAIPTCSGMDLAIEALLSPVYRIREARTRVGIPEEIVVEL